MPSIQHFLYYHSKDGDACDCAILHSFKVLLIVILTHETALDHVIKTTETHSRNTGYLQDACE